MGDWLDFWVIMAVAIINAVDRLRPGGPRREGAGGHPRACCRRRRSARRDGGWVTVPAAELVPGDVVRLDAGRQGAGRRPAASRRSSCASTSRRSPASRCRRRRTTDAGRGRRRRRRPDVDGVLRHDRLGRAGAGHRHRRPAPSTEIGKIQSLADEAGSLDTPLTRQLDQFGRVLTLVILGDGGRHAADRRVTCTGCTFDELISATIGFAVAAIPEGLPALVTITLALGVQQMAKQQRDHAQAPRRRGARVGDDGLLRQDRHADQERDDGAADRDAGRDLRRHRARLRARRRRSSRLTAPVAGGDLSAILAVATLCNDAHIVPRRRLDRGLGARRRAHRGRAQGRRDEGRRRRRRQHAGSRCVPFDSANKFMATLNDGADGSRAILVKGAPDRLLERSTAQRGASGPRAARRRAVGGVDRRAQRAGAAGAGGGAARRSARTSTRSTVGRPRATSSSSACGASSTRPGPRRSTRSRTATPPASG